VNAPAARRIEAMQRCSALRLAHAALVVERGGPVLFVRIRKPRREISNDKLAPRT
jgi:hypothetical protein